MKTTQSQSNAPVFDVEKLTNQFDNRKFALEIAAHFLSTIPEYRAELEVCLTQQCSKQFLSFSHRLKEAAATVKAHRITSVAIELESSAENNQLEHVHEKVSELLGEFEFFANAVCYEYTTD